LRCGPGILINILANLEHLGSSVKGQAGSSLGSARFISPFGLAANSDWIAIGALSDIPDGGVLAKEMGGEKTLLFRQGLVVICFTNACAHLGLSLDGGLVDAGMITCPHHGFQYDLVSAECLIAPQVQLHAHAVRIIGHRVEVRLAR
jgi:nitrite reductase/ring-hydroxylating ferredoxin subunit